MVRRGEGVSPGTRAPAEYSCRRRHERHPRLDSKVAFTDGLGEGTVSRRVWEVGQGRVPGLLCMTNTGRRLQGVGETLQTHSTPPSCMPEMGMFCVYGYISIKTEGAAVIPHLLKLAHSQEPSSQDQKIK